MRVGTDPSPLAGRRIAVLHNRYRVAGGEERYHEQLTDLLERHAENVSVIERASDEVGRAAAGAALVRGGNATAARETGRVVGDVRAGVLHAHNVHPAFGCRALAAARRAGAAVVLHLHNYRLFCATGIAFRDGADCSDCAPRRTWRGLAHNCRGGAAEAAAYALGLGLWQQRLIECVDVFVSPTRQLAGDLRELGLDLPVEVLPTWLPDDEIAERSVCEDGGYAIYAGRIAEEKGVLVAIAAAAAADVPLMVAGEGPDLDRARALAADLNAPVEFAGRLDAPAMAGARAGAAFALLPSVWREVLPFAALEAMAAGLPLLVSRRGGLPELTAPELCFEPGDADALAAGMRRLWHDPAARSAAGEAALARVREHHSEESYVPRLARVYDRALERRTAG